MITINDIRNINKDETVKDYLNYLQNEKCKYLLSNKSGYDFFFINNITDKINAYEDFFFTDQGLRKGLHLIINYHGHPYVDKNVNEKPDYSHAFFNPYIR